MNSLGNPSLLATVISFVVVFIVFALTGNTVEAADVGRMIAIGEGILIFMVTGVIIYFYQRAYAQIEKKKEKSQGLLPHHVYLIGISYVIIVASSCINHLDRLGDPFTVFIPISIVGFALGLYALYLILTFERRRIT